MSQLSTDKLADLISKRHRCLLQLRDLGRKQAELIAQGDMGHLLRLLGAKDQLIVAVQTIEQELAPFHSQIPEQRTWINEQTRTKSAELSAQCKQLLEEVMQLEQQNEKQMTLRRDQVAHQLQAAQAAGTARSAYQAQQRNTPQGPHLPASHFSTTDVSSQLDLQSEV